MKIIKYISLLACLLIILFFNPKAFSQFDVSGQVKETDIGIVNARVTLFNNDQSVFFEERADVLGDFNFDSIPAGIFTIGVTALNKSYESISLEIVDDTQNINISVSEENHQRLKKYTTE